MARSVTLVAGNQNVDLPNGLAYSATNRAQGPFAVTAVASNGTTVTFTAANNLTAGQTVTLSGLAGGYAGLNGAQTVASASGTQFTVTNSTASGATTTGTATVTGINGPTIYLSDDEGAKLNPKAFTDGVLVDGGTVVGPVRKVTIVAGNYNVQLPNGIVYNATNPTTTNGPVVYLTVDEGAALVVNSALVDGGWITSGS